ncbi:glutamate synthase large subunit [Bacteroides uniformis]|jgi:glutamate synthase (NADPH/NADH) large chain|uniref:Glutamate synthase [NADPH] large chain n=2 Tax=Bacteroides uniformis TaxID=820 RepID=A0ABD4WBY9_BACUN|nr:glutamate synthase large subunit [Bacteroides uniformis]MDC1785416.1 glutamate synthase large subunit [Bacteroides uniformis]MDC1791075.1 glutamate synthase large subunit [Bacteroides uniformis]MDC1793184.1 glutamate synthase large subunit [Bacteroides uniformis]RGX99078.1 glutamate synthase large subunit [Bacteroides uniformis]RHD41272.1 glutamate synthase large subunit [Bacteroides uniformis]
MKQELFNNKTKAEDYQRQPKQLGLYEASHEHDACGVGMLVNIQGGKSHELVESALKVLENMRHRGAEGADNKTGDGAGIMLQIPHEFILLQGIPVPEKGKYGTGLLFLPKDGKDQAVILSVIIEEIEKEGLTLMHLRNVPTCPEILGEAALANEPDIKQIFITGFTESETADRKLYIIRKRIENRIRKSDIPTREDFYIVSLSTKNIVYKGMLSSLQLRNYFPDLTNSYFTSGLALVHSRFSTNTFPTWGLAQPFRLLAHNGEINTIRGNRGWMEARESVLSSPALGDIREIRPIVQPGMSDSASLDNVLEFLIMSGLSLPHAMAMLVPESFNEKNPISEDLKAFYEYHSILMEPWDGPAALLFSDGRYAGGMLDRNGLRPARYLITQGGMMVVASEVGVMDFEPGDIKEKGRLQPGKILLIDTEKGEIYYDGELKKQLAEAKPYRTWLAGNRIELDELKSGRKVSHSVENYDSMLRIFGYSKEDVERLIVPMCTTGAEPINSMGNDTPLAVLSDKPQLLYNYFRQQFAQVTNPPIDPIREELVMSLTEYIGAVGMNILTPSENHCKMVRLNHPILNNAQLDILCNIRYKGFKTVKLPLLFEVAKGCQGLQQALATLCKQAEESVNEGVNYIVLSDRDVDAAHAAIPSLLAVSAVHHHLISVGKRVQTALIVESGEIREVMHAALLLGFGASALNPYMAFAVIDKLVNEKEIQLDYATAEKKYIKSVCKGLFKIMSKMGISTIRSYRGAKIFEAVGLSEELSNAYFGGLSSRIGGIRLDEVARDAIAFHKEGMEVLKKKGEAELLPNRGLYAFRKDGEKHAWNPETISTLQLATRLGSYKKFKEFTAMVDSKESPIFLRDFLDFRRAPISIDRVEPVENIVQRFVTGAMSYGSISREAHEAMAIAMNKLHGRSNTGEGGEDRARFIPREDGTSLRSAIKQVASGRFGVTAEYLVNADEIQIKIAQGAKPGEGGQLPGFKVDEVIAKTRHSIPGISLISPPPHHDIYSIEDLAQLIFDLKNVNPRAKISVKLVAESGVGTIAAGVAKAKADLIVISGAEGGTGASPASSIRYAGISPELGLSETQQTLVLNGLRGQVMLQVDGQLKTGRDIILMAMLGAEEFGFATSALIVLGCVMMRKCHQNTCPVGVATQNEELRKRFRGRSEYLVNFFTFLAQEVREYLAEIGVERLDDIIGRTDLIVRKPDDGIRKHQLISFDKLLARVDNEAAIRHVTDQQHGIDHVKDVEMLHAAAEAVENQKEISLEYTIANTDRACGAMLSGVIAAKYGEKGLPEHTLNVKFKGSAGQSFGAFLVPGVNFKLEGEANDYLGKGLSGGRIAVLPPVRSNFEAEKNTIAGNTLLYGATSGEVYINGRAGERFAVRNSGATAVVEGVGDHCCEYMTGGRVVVLGQTGRNFAAGMSGGVAYVWNRDGNFDYFCNMEMVELSLIEEASYRKELHELIRQHYLYTGSKLARTMLDDWPRYADQFIQVVPIEYKKVLQEEQMQKLQQKIAEMQRDY